MVVVIVVVGINLNFKSIWHPLIVTVTLWIEKHLTQHNKKMIESIALCWCCWWRCGNDNNLWMKKKTCVLIRVTRVAQDCWMREFEKCNLGRITLLTYSSNCRSHSKNWYKECTTFTLYSAFALGTRFIHSKKNFLFHFRIYFSLFFIVWRNLGETVLAI